MPGFPLFLVLCAAALPAPQRGADVVHLPHDPDRGLAAAFRERLRLVDPKADASWPAEHWAQIVDLHLRELAQLWAEDRLERGLAALSWIDQALEVAVLLPEATEAVLAQGVWRIARGRKEQAESRRLPLARALADWRAAFQGDSRLDVEVFGIDADEGQVVSSVRWVASGLGQGARLQHNATWTCRWRTTQDGLTLAALQPEGIELVALADHPAGMYADVTASLLEQAPAVREQLAVALDEWRLRIPASLEPGSLGHHGIALGDVNADGLEDLYLCQPGGLPNRLLLHQPDGTVRDVSAQAGVDWLDYSSSALLLELDQDGDVDLLVSTGTALVFHSNDGAGHFQERLRLPRSLATSLAAADFDLDGDLDVYVCSYLSPYEKDGLPVPYHDAENGEANVLLRNDGEWSFVDATAEVGLDQNNRRFSFAAAWEDYDNDGDQDLYVANDFGRNNLYRNDGGRFRDVAPELGAEDISAGMGVSWGDADGDGWMDLYVTNMYTPAACRLTARGGFRPGAPTSEGDYRDHAMGNSLLLSRQAREFSDVAEASGTGMGRWGWGALFLDLDDDGRLDLFAPNGFSTGERREDLDSFFWRQVVLQSPQRSGESSDAYAQGWRAVNRLVRQGWSWNGNERNVAYLNVGQARFVDVSSATGLDLPDDARASARADWDADGDEDLIVTNRTAPMFRLLAHQGSGSARWIAFALRGTRCNTAAVGARVTIETRSGRRFLATLRCGEGYLAQSSSRLRFALGAEEIERVVVRWPAGDSEDFGRPTAGAAYLLVQGSGRADPLPAPGPSSRLVPGALAAAGSTGSARTVLAAPLPLPSLALETIDGQPASLLGIDMQGPSGTGRPLLLVLWGSTWPTTCAALEALGSAAETLSAAGLQVLALSVDQGLQRERARTTLRDMGWSLAAGFASEEAIQVFEIVQGTLHDSARSLAVPAAFLVDPGGMLIATYQGQLDPQQVRADLGLIELAPDARRDAAVPFRGRWITPPQGTLDGQVAARLAAHGLERAAAEYSLARVETRPFSASGFQVEVALARLRQGQLDEAIRLFRQALELDPGHLGAARGLGLALHQKGELRSAIQAYRSALALEPADAQTRLNLGRALLALGEVEAARNELRALRNLRSELADALEQSIRLAEQGR